MGYIKVFGSTIKVWAGLLRKSRGFYFLYGVSQLLAISMDMAYTLVVAKAFQGILDQAVSSGSSLSRMMIYYLLIVLLTVGLWGFGDNYISNRLQDKLQIHFRRKMLQSMLAAPLYGEAEVPLGDFSKRYSMDVKTAVQFLVRRISSTLISPLLGGIGCLVLLWGLHPALALTAFGIGLLVFFLQKIPLPHAASYAEAQTSAEGEFSIQLHDAVTNLPVLRMFGAIPFIFRRVSAANGTILEVGRKKLKIDVSQQTLMLGLPFLQTLSILIVGGILIGRGLITLGGLFAAVTYSETVCYMFDGVSRGLASVQNGRASGERVLQILTLAPQKRKACTDCTVPYALVSQNVSLILNGQRLLTDVNFSLKSGEKVAITGMSGSGKSTLARLLSGAYEEYEGTLSLSSDRVYYVSSNSYLLSGTVAENISSFAEQTDEKKIKRLLTLLCLDSLEIGRASCRERV